VEFTFVYDGPLKTNRSASIEDKQAIRRVFHSQLRLLWQQRPLKDLAGWLQDDVPKHRYSAIRKIGPFAFAPLVTEALCLTAELNIFFLRPEPPGALITQGGDIDNRLKTLFDALRMPKRPSEIPSNDGPLKDEMPFFCLLEDDNLITKIAVKTDRLLKGSMGDNNVHLLIGVTTKRIVGTAANLGLG